MSGLSHGRGGAGNIGPGSRVNPETLETPTIKSQVYTTGRGGTGNMAKNTDPEEARRAQDVIGTARTEGDAATHVGRGGAGNAFRSSQEDKRPAVAGEEAKKDKSILDKAKELLGGNKNGKA